MRVTRLDRLAAASVALILAATLSGGDPASGQSVGLEVGLAGIENYDPFAPSFGASLTVPVISRLSMSATYARWLGRDGNEDFFGGGDDLRLGYGNQAVLLSGLLRVIGDQGVNLSLGAGIGWFQHYRIEGGASRSWYDATPTGLVLVRFANRGRIAPYIRADVQIPSHMRLNYGLLRVGADITIR